MPKRFSASAAAQLMACPGSANLELAIPGWQEPEREEGKGRKGIGTTIHSILEQAGQLTPRDMQRTAEAMLYVAELRRTRRFQIETEVEVVADWLPSKPKTTVDVVLWTQDELHIIDYKAGMIGVDAYRNKQGLFYAACHHKKAPKAKSISIHIVQPWAKDGNSVWEVSAQEVAQFMLDAIEVDEKILAGDITLNPSDHCTFCPANPHGRGDKGSPFCPAMMDFLGYGPRFNEDEILNL